jgi:hypothetical protein
VGANNISVKTVPVSSSKVLYTKAEPVKTQSLGLPIQSHSTLPTADVKDPPRREKTRIQSEEQAIVKSPGIDVKSNANIAASNTPIVSKPIITNLTKAQTKNTETLPTPARQDVLITRAVLNEANQKITTTSIVPAAQFPDKSLQEIIAPAAVVYGRKSEFSQTVNFKSDSLVLALYDNGEIDGDTVSVYLNGKVLMADQGLKATAIKKTIYLTPGKDDEFTIVLYAENLGKYPPNTGLLVVHDGDDIYNLLFSSDFQKNAGIVFKRKK